MNKFINLPYLYSQCMGEWPNKNTLHWTMRWFFIQLNTRIALTPTTDAYFYHRRRRTFLAIQYPVDTAASPNHVTMYDKCSFLSVMFVWPPMGPPLTDEFTVASKNTGSAPVMSHILSRSLQNEKAIDITLFLSQNTSATKLPVQKIYAHTFRHELWPRLALSHQPDHVNCASNLSLWSAGCILLVSGNPPSIDQNCFSVRTKPNVNRHSSTQPKGNMHHHLLPAVQFEWSDYEIPRCILLAQDAPFVPMAALRQKTPRSHHQLFVMQKLSANSHRMIFQRVEIIQAV